LDATVKDIDEWGMYTWMVDENESQKTVTPELIYENIEAGINFLEPVVRRCETAEEFGSIVYRYTIGSHKPSDYARVRNAVLSGEGLGVEFLSQTLPGDKSTARNNIQAVVDSHYAGSKASAKLERAKAKAKEAEAARKEADAARDKEAARKAREKAEALEAEAKSLREAAYKLREYGVDQNILLAFENARQMTGFAESVKAIGIPKAHHAQLANYLRQKGTPGRDFRNAINAWWYVASGKAMKDRAAAQRDAFKRKHRSKSVDEFMGEVAAGLRDLRVKVDALIGFTSACENATLRASIEKQAEEMRHSLSALVDDLHHTNEREVSNQVKMLA
jgi:hypothetical protein